MLRITSKTSPCGGQIFGGRGAVVDGEILLGGVDAGGRDVLFGGIDSGDLGAEPGHGLGQEAAAAADVEEAQALERAVWRKGSRAKRAVTCSLI